MILHPFIPNMTYTEGDFVLDPETDVVFQVAGDGDGPVTVDERAPAQSPFFVLAKDLPEK